MSDLLDGVRFLASAGGTSDFTVSSAATGYQTPASGGAVNNGVYSYRAESSDLSQWEIGVGAYSTTGPVQARTTVLFSSTGSKVSFTNPPLVALTALAEDFMRAQTPHGRLTLVSGTPVMTSDQTAKTVIYYTPHVGAYYWVYDGTLFRPRLFSEVSVTLDTTNVLSGALYDAFMYNDAGTDRLGYGPSWAAGAVAGSTTARGTGAGSTELQRVNGLWTNKNSITLRYDSTHTTSVAANKALYVGTFYATANGQTGMMFAPAAAAGGGANVLGLYNAYNRVPVITQGHDTGGGGWSYTGAGVWRPSDNSTANSVTFIDGLQESHVSAQFTQQMATASSAVLGAVGINLDSTSATPTSIGGNSNGTSGSAFAMNTFAPQLGKHVLTMMEMTSGGSATFFGFSSSSPYHAYFAQLDM